MFQTTFTHWALLWDLGLWWFCPDNDLIFRLFLAVYVFSKFVKLVPLFARRPSDLLYLGVSVFFGFFHGLIKLHAGLTLHEVRNPTIFIYFGPKT